MCVQKFGFDMLLPEHAETDNTEYHKALEILSKGETN